EDEIETRKVIETKLNIISTSAKDDNSEYEIEDVKSYNRHEALTEFQTSLDDISLKITQIIIDPPDEYVKRFKTTKPHQKYIAEFLGLKLKEVKDIYVKIRMKYVEQIGNPYS